jgi:hypothetical protein
MPFPAMTSGAMMIDCDVAATMNSTPLIIKNGIFLIYFGPSSIKSH